MRKRPTVVTAYYKDAHRHHWWVRSTHHIESRQWHGEIRWSESCVGWDEATPLFFGVELGNRNPAPFEWINMLKQRIHLVSCEIGDVWNGDANAH